jgi:hypothetical protein
MLGIVLAGWRESLNGCCMKITLASTSRSHIADCKQNPALFGARARKKPAAVQIIRQMAAHTF